VIRGDQRERVDQVVAVEQALRAKEAQAS